MAKPIDNGIKIAYWVLIGVEIFLYVVGWPVMEVSLEEIEFQRNEDLKRTDDIYD